MTAGYSLVHHRVTETILLHNTLGSIVAPLDPKNAAPLSADATFTMEAAPLTLVSLATYPRWPMAN